MHKVTSVKHEHNLEPGIIGEGIYHIHLQMPEDEVTTHPGAGWGGQGEAVVPKQVPFLRR